MTDVASEKDTRAIAVEAFLFGYPLVLMDLTRAVMTNVAQPQASSAPENQIGQMRAFPDASFTDVVSPNADTLYSVAWLDVSAEPVVLRQPDGGDRYFLLPMLDGWTNVFASPGTRTTGSGAAVIRNRRPSLERRAAGRCPGNPVANRDGVDDRAHADQRQGGL